MKRNEKLTYITCNAIFQVNDYDQARSLLLTIPQSIFKEVSIPALSYYVDAIKHMYSIANANQKYFCNVQLERVMLSLYRDALKRSIDEEESKYGPEETEQILGILSIMAKIYSEQGEKIAENEVREAIILIEDQKAKQAESEQRDLDMANSFVKMANTFKEKGEYSSALEYSMKALSIYEEIRGTEHPDTATTYNNMAIVYKAMGEYKKAMEYYEKALTIREKVFGTEHPSTATTYNNIANVYYNMGKYDKALEYFEKALVINEKVLGTEHPSTATTYNNMAIVYKAIGDYDKALEYAHKAREINEKAFGEDNSKTKGVYTLLSDLYAAKEDHERSHEYAVKAGPDDE